MSASTTTEGMVDIDGTDATNEPSKMEDRMTAPGYAGP